MKLFIFVGIIASLKIRISKVQDFGNFELSPMCSIIFCCCRISELDFLTEAEAGTLRQLQKAYRQENKPPGLRDTSLTNFNGRKNNFSV